MINQETGNNDRAPYFMEKNTLILGEKLYGEKWNDIRHFGVSTDNVFRITYGLDQSAFHRKTPPELIKNHNRAKSSQTIGINLKRKHYDEHQNDYPSE